MRHFRALLALYAGLMAARDAAAAGRPRILPPPKLFENHLRIDLAPEAIDLDGRLSEWPALVRAEQMSMAGPGTRFEFGLATDGVQLFVGARVSNQPPPFPREEHVEITLRFMTVVEKPRDLRGSPPPAVCPPLPPGKPWILSLKIPAAGGASTAESHEPGGVPTRLSAASVRVQRRADGFEVEASMPWSAIRPAAAGMLALRAGAVYHANSMQLRIGDDQTFAPLPFEQLMMVNLDEYARHLVTWLKPTELWSDCPFVADLLGDARYERISVVGDKVTVCRSAGTCEEIAFERLDGIEARDVTGRGKADLIVKHTKSAGVGDSRMDHEVLEIWSPRREPAEIPYEVLAPIFRHEVAVRLCCASEMYVPPALGAAVKLERGLIEIRAHARWRAWDRTRHPVVPLGGEILPPVLPWDRPPVHRYRWRGGAFVAERP